MQSPAPVFVTEHPQDAAGIRPWRVVVTCLCGTVMYSGFMAALAHFRLFPHQDKAAHVLASFFLTLLLRWSLGLETAAVTGAALGVGGVDEMLQVFQEGRNADPLDYLADVLGAFLACAVLWQHSRTRPPSGEEEPGAALR